MEAPVGTAPNSHSSSNEVVTLPARVLSRLLMIIANFTYENPLFWNWLRGRKNPRADLAGPYHIIGAPQRQFMDGKVILASKQELESFSPFLLYIHVRGPNGERVKHATFDWWQADTAGNYSHATYSLRGKFKTDAAGDVEILTVTPGKYGPEAHVRAGHFHAIVGGPARRWQALTTQMYVCRGNDAGEMQSDFLNFVRPPRPANMLEACAVEENFMDLPRLRLDDVEARERLNGWQARLALLDVDAKVVACAQTELRLNS